MINLEIWLKNRNKYFLLQHEKVFIFYDYFRVQIPSPVLIYELL